MNYFKIFNIKEEFKINYNKLSKNFHKLQRKFHPDMNINIDDKNIKNKSSEINIAYRILKNPIKRAEYIIKINCSKNIYEENICNKKFLLYFFKINKKIENLEKNIRKNKKKINKILEKIKVKKKKYYKKIEKYIKNKKWIKSKNILIKIKFLNKILKKKCYNKKI
ncbi:Fe-S protein assembly co-chaperone HscB [Buchnera aphidicola (Pseudoregma panicola)]|uniref:Fe-S protein assembly co-chaperone HscB n=1 Tax=Buchnera aphidicola TaxID=9 RepID=UPI0031B68A99